MERLCQIALKMERDGAPFRCYYGIQSVIVRMAYLPAEEGIPGLKVEIKDSSALNNDDYFKHWITLKECQTPNGEKVLIPKLENKDVYVFDDPSQDPSMDKIVLRTEFPKPSDFHGEIIVSLTYG